MKIFKITFFSLIFFYFSLVSANENILQNKITKNLRCLVCQGQSVYDSDSTFAVSLKLLVKKKLELGMSENEIYNFLTIKYGDWILYDPKFNKNTYLLWLLPLLIFILGGAIVSKKLIKFKK